MAAAALAAIKAGKAAAADAVAAQLQPLLRAAGDAERKKAAAAHGKFVLQAATLIGQALGKKGLPEAQARAYREHMLLMLDQVRRLCDSCEPCGGGDGGRRGEKGGRSRGADGAAVDSCEAECLQLRRDLALAKLEVAELSGGRERLEHEVRHLRALHGGRSSRSLFG